jgi:ribosomal protein L32E
MTPEKQIKQLQMDLSSMKKAFNLANNWRNEHLDDSKKLQKIKEIINIDSVGWASPKVLIDTLKREVFEK